MLIFLVIFGVVSDVHQQRGNKVQAPKYREARLVVTKLKDCADATRPQFFLALVRQCLHQQREASRFPDTDPVDGFLAVATQGRKKCSITNFVFRATVAAKMAIHNAATGPSCHAAAEANVGKAQLMASVASLQVSIPVGLRCSRRNRWVRSAHCTLSLAA